MSDIITDTTPLNLLEEKAKFVDDKTYNPQFKYNRSFTAQELTVWGPPQLKYYDHAVRMMTRYPHQRADQPVYVSPTDIEAAVDHFNHEYHLLEPISVEFSADFVTRCRISTKTLFFQLPLHYTQDKFQDLYRHELETHMLRRLNQRQQPWASHFKIDEPNFRRTEEGIASLHTHLLRKDKVFRKSYLTYIAVYLAQQASFTRVYHTLIEYGVSPSTAWNISVRTKRGLEDTSQPGGLTKDICYFEGAVKIWNWILNPENDPHDLYLGRLTVEQLSELKPQAKTENLYYPSFMAHVDEYRNSVQEIGLINEFEQLV